MRASCPYLRAGRAIAMGIPPKGWENRPRRRSGGIPILPLRFERPVAICPESLDRVQIAVRFDSENDDPS
jgi:hypothetical protein